MQKQATEPSQHARTSAPEVSVQSASRSRRHPACSQHRLKILLCLFGRNLRARTLTNMSCLAVAWCLLLLGLWQTVTASQVSWLCSSELTKTSSAGLKVSNTWLPADSNPESLTCSRLLSSCCQLSLQKGLRLSSGHCCCCAVHQQAVNRSVVCCRLQRQLPVLWEGKAAQQTPSASTPPETGVDATGRRV